MNKFIVFLLCVSTVILSFTLQHYNKLPLGNSCLALNKQISFSPNKVVSIHMQSYICGFFQKKSVHMKVDFAENQFEWEISNNNVNWSGKSLFVWPYSLPKIIWKNNYEADLYVKDQIRYGSEIIKLDKELYIPIIIRIHYES